MNVSASTIERINAQTLELPEPFQVEVLHFVEFLKKKAEHEETIRAEDFAWSDLSLGNAVRGIDDDEIHDYTDADFIEKWK
jgi:hypothetical protein